jgi:predicted  nucleic acid-binding Zn-ribbon protein
MRGTLAASPSPQIKPTIYVYPSTYVATHMGEKVSISVNIKNVTEDMQLIGVQFWLRYNTTLLETKEDWIIEGPFLQEFAPYNTAFIKYVDDGYGKVGILILPNATGEWNPPFPEGDGTLATITFNVIYRPTEAEPKASCILELTDTMLLDVNLEEIAHNSENGYYEITPLSFPGLTVRPDPYMATHVGEIFRINIDIERVDRDWQLVGVQWKLEFNATILNVLNVTEGDFFKKIAAAAGPDYGTFFYWIREYDYIISFTLYYKFPAPPTVFPEGSGTLAIITFNTTYGPPAYCKLHLMGTMLLDVNEKEIPHTVKDGYYKFLALPAPEDVPPLQVEVDAGTIHFNGEIAQFYILTTYKGVAVNASLYPLLYKPDGSIEALTYKWIGQGFYKIEYEIAINAPIGTYALLVEADYNATSETGPIETTGTSFKCFQVSSTLTIWNKSIESIEDDIATIIIPYLGQIKVNLTSINAKLVSINGTTANIETSIGEIQADINDILVNLDSIEGNIATIETTLGKVQVDTADIKATLVSIDGDVATINSTVGSIRTKVDAIHLKVVNIDWETKIANIQTSLGTIKGYVENVDDGGLATINTDLGTVKTSISDIQGAQGTLSTLQYVVLVLALIAAIGAVLCVLYMRKK